MRKFKMLPSVKKSYEEQGEIFFACRNFARQDERVREKIVTLCREAAGEYAPALFAYLTTGDSWQEVTMRHNISDRTLDRCRWKFYSAW